MINNPLLNIIKVSIKPILQSLDQFHLFNLKLNNPITNSVNPKFMKEANIKEKFYQYAKN
jgi:hypothetical protein